ncbi:hypothetical protein BC342_31290 [Streptomyces olivaceus]|nr:hypothetical protein BC342_31290 [Streptomyces olivaceus]
MADQDAVLRVGGDAFGLLVGAWEGLAEVGHQDRVRRALRAEVEAGFGEQGGDVRGDGEGGGEAGGADAADRDTAQFRVGADAVVVVLGGGAQSGVDGGDLLVQQCGEDAAALLAQGAQSLGGGLGGVLVVEVLGGGAQQDVAVDGRCDQDALAEGGGDRQQDVPDEGAGERVVDDELAPARGDGEVVEAETPVEGVGVQSGRVDEPAGVQGPRGVVRRWTPSWRPAGSTGVFRCRSTPARTAWVAYARVVVQGQMMLSPGTWRAPSAPGPRWGSRAYRSAGPRRRVSWYALRAAFSARRGRAASCCSSQATSRAPTRSTGMPDSVA